MKTIGLIISHKENEKRRALVPGHAKCLKHPECIFIEKGYGNVLGYSDEDYVNQEIKCIDNISIVKLYNTPHPSSWYVKKNIKINQ